MATRGKKCLVKSAFGHPGDECILHPKKCKTGLSFSVWEKVLYKEDVFNIYKSHDKQFIFSTGGDFDLDKKMSYPGLALYHEGMHLVAVVSTGEDVWQLKVTGQLINETWSNIGVRWEPYINDPTIELKDRGGLELYINAEKVGHSLTPIRRPRADDSQIPPFPGFWTVSPPLQPGNDETWANTAATQPPVLMVGCHRNADGAKFEHFSQSNTVHDELSIWTRKLQVNRTHNEVLYFTSGYMSGFENLGMLEFFTMLDTMDLNNPYQAEAAAYVINKYTKSNNSLDLWELLPNTTYDSNDGPLPSDLDRFYRDEDAKTAYVEQMIESSVRLKLLSTENLKPLEKPKYLSRRLNVLPVYAQVLEDTHRNLDGWKSVQMDPHEEGSSKILKAMKNYVLEVMSTADIWHDEDFEPIYSMEKNDFTIHSSSPAYVMSVSKVFPEKFRTYGTSLNVGEFFNNHPVNPSNQWLLSYDTMEIPTQFYFVNNTDCGKKPFTFMAGRYQGYSMMAPIRRNNEALRSKKLKLDSDVFSFDIQINPGLNESESDIESLDCQIDETVMKYSPIKMRFFHLDPQTSLRKLLWHEDDLQSEIDIRRCAVYNEDIGVYGGWDTEGCTTVLTEQDNTVCECSKLGTYALVAEIKEKPWVKEEPMWLELTKYAGYGISLLLIVLFCLIIVFAPAIWDMFHILRLNIGFCYLLSLTFMVVAEFSKISEDRHSNIGISMIQQVSILSTSCFILFESFATFRAITAGIIGGKTWSYIPLAYGISLMNLGVTIYMYGDDYGTDPRVFFGWENETKWVFFYTMMANAFISILLCLVVLFNTATPQTRKDSVVEQLAAQAQGLAIFVFIYSMTWAFALPAFIRYPDKEMPDFYPIFAILNSGGGVFLFCFLGLTSAKFRMALLGQAKKKRDQFLKGQFAAIAGLKNSDEDEYEQEEPEEDHSSRPSTVLSKIEENDSDSDEGEISDSSSSDDDDDDDDEE